jgi:hypothetical protein
MDLTLLRMISTGSLSAFSAGATNGALGQLGAVRPARAQAPPPTDGVAAAPGTRASPPASEPGKIAPRGSLLDLSV